VRTSSTFTAIAAAGLLAAVAACSSSPTSTDPPSVTVAAAGITSTLSAVLTQGEISVCKVGSSATFSAALTPGGATTLSLADGECKLLVSSPSSRVDAVVTEDAALYTTVDSIVRYFGVGSGSSIPPQNITTTKLTGTSSATAQAGTDTGTILVFYNTFAPPPPPPPPPPSGGEGCTPGYWKQTQHFHSYTAPYAPTTLFSDVFENAFPGMTLQQVLSNGGGGLDALGRHTVAALLNAASGGVSYNLTVQQVIDQFNAVYPGTKADYESLKDVFAGYNEQTCPLN
jgi:hypothetical protein